MPDVDEPQCIDPNDPTVAMAGPPVTPPSSQIPVDPWIHDQPGDGWWLVESEPPGFQRGNPLPVRPNDPMPPSTQPSPQSPIDPAEPVPDTLRSPDVQPPAESPGPEIPVEQPPETPVEPWEAPEPIEPGPDTLRSVAPEAEATELGEGAEVLTEGTEVAEGLEAVELAEGGAALGEALPVAAAGVAGYALGSAIAPYVYGDKNLDGSPVEKTESVDDIDTDYQNSWAYKINQWLDD